MMSQKKLGNSPRNEEHLTFLELSYLQDALADLPQTFQRSFPWHKTMTVKFYVTGFYFVEVTKVKTRVYYRKLISLLEIFLRGWYSFHLNCSLLFLVQADHIFAIYFSCGRGLRVNSEQDSLEPDCAWLCTGTCGKAEALVLYPLEKEPQLESFSHILLESL